MIISMIAAVAEGGVIGVNGQMPWHLPDDLRFFRKMTMGKPVVMGRVTLQSLGRPLKGRHNIVLTRDSSFAADGCTVVSSIEAALEAAGSAPELMVIGGAQVYRQFLPLANRLYLTVVHHRFAGDARFPDLDENEWQLVEMHAQQADERNQYAFATRTLVRAASVESLTAGAVAAVSGSRWSSDAP